jgi:hypothetical protein
MEHQPTKGSGIVPAKDKPGLEAVHEWRNGIFKTVAEIMTNPHIPTVQKQIGIWYWNVGIPLPQRESLLIIGQSGTMSFRTLIDGEEIFFSIFMFLGEVRLGFRIPNPLLERNEQIKEALSLCYDGERCPRMVESEDAVFFDWIFKDRGMASTALMAKAVDDKIASALIADAIANAMLHIYMSVLNIVLTLGNYSIVPDKGLMRDEHAASYMFDVSGALELFEEEVEKSALKIVDKMPQTNSRAIYILKSPADEDAEALRQAAVGAELDVIMNRCVGELSA